MLYKSRDDALRLPGAGQQASNQERPGVARAGLVQMLVVVVETRDLSVLSIHGYGR